jgi:predicted outer membrane repeat protein
LNQVSFINSESDTVEKDGGAMYNNGSSGGSSSPVLYQVTFSENGGIGTERGGAMYNNGANSGHSNPKLTAVTFRSNVASFGGAIFNDATAGGESSPELDNVTFHGNKSGFGGALLTWGSDSGVSNPKLTNVTFSENSDWSSAIENDADATGSGSLGQINMVLNNVIMWGQEGRTQIEKGGPGVSVTVSHSIIVGGCPAGSTCTEVSAADPMLSTLSNHGGFTFTMMPATGSPAIDAGDDDPFVCPGTDQRGVARPQGEHCDIGAVERQRNEDIIFKDGFDLF